MTPLMAMLRRAWPLLAGLTLAVAVGAVFGSTLLGPDWLSLGVVAVVVVALATFWVHERGNVRTVWSLAAAIVAMGVGLVGLLAIYIAPLAMVELFGEPVQARVTAVRDGIDGREYKHRIRLARPDGTAIPGELTLPRDAGTKQGDQLAVLSDRTGVANPVPADEPVTGSAAFLVILWLAVAGPAVLCGMAPDSGPTVRGRERRAAPRDRRRR
ncbi:hypothetical protein [Catellatospora sichuanensis]|uniref:hypothetical protein n=1 Tax=Catellatospora sichuanensis TaxID=1969805 RepID=UPI001183F81B|nr:hypothetical protein [Catellatospora sichuanensis]